MAKAGEDPQQPLRSEAAAPSPANAAVRKLPKAPDGQVWMVANATAQDGMWRGGVRWAHVAPGEEEPQLVDKDKVDLVLNEPRLRGARVVGDK